MWFGYEVMLLRVGSTTEVMVRTNHAWETGLPNKLVGTHVNGARVKDRNDRKPESRMENQPTVGQKSSAVFVTCSEKNGGAVCNEDQRSENEPETGGPRPTTSILFVSIGTGCGK